MQIVRPGGEFITGFGGHILVTPPGQSTAVEIMVAQWQLVLYFRNAECTHTGCMGAPARRRVLYDYSFAAELPVQKQIPADVYLAREDTVGLELLKGDPADYTQGQAESFKSPAAILSTARTVLDGTGKNILRMDVAGDAASLMFHLPFERESYDWYIQQLQDRGWIQ